MNHDHDKQIQAAFEAGYSHAIRNYYDTRHLDCRCHKCLKSYDAGQQAGTAERAAQV